MPGYHVAVLLLVWCAAIVGLFSGSPVPAVLGTGLLLSTCVVSVWSLSVTAWLVNSFRDNLVWNPASDRSREVVIQMLVGLFSGISLLPLLAADSYLAHLSAATFIVLNIGFQWKTADKVLRERLVSDRPPRHSRIPMIRLTRQEAENALDQLAPQWGFSRANYKATSQL